MPTQTQKFLKTWYQVIEQHDFKLLEKILADDITFHSPAFWKPKEGKQMAMMILMSVDSIFKNFVYTHEWVMDNQIILEFTASVGDKNIKGLDRITLNENGQAQEFEVLVRPLNGLMALAAAMGEKLGLKT